jgi:hypothetical protein
MRGTLAALVVCGLVGSDCGGRDAPAVSSVPARTRPVELAVADLAARLRISRTRVRVIAAEQQTWRSGCLGLPSPELCPREKTPGYKVTLAVGGRRHVYHTDRNQTVRYASHTSGLLKEVEPGS